VIFYKHSHNIQILCILILILNFIFNDESRGPFTLWFIFNFYFTVSVTIKLQWLSWWRGFELQELFWTLVLFYFIYRPCNDCIRITPRYTYLICSSADRCLLNIYFIWMTLFHNHAQKYKNNKTWKLEEYERAKISCQNLTESLLVVDIYILILYT